VLPSTDWEIWRGELIEQADAHGVTYARIGMDSFYGRDSGLLCWIEDRGREFYADIPENLHIWLSPPLGEKRPTSPAKTPKATSAWPTIKCANGKPGTGTWRWSRSQDSL
jgi:hypothetical protein